MPCGSLETPAPSSDFPKSFKAAEEKKKQKQKKGGTEKLHKMTATFCFICIYFKSYMSIFCLQIFLYLFFWKPLFSSILKKKMPLFFSKPRTTPVYIDKQNAFQKCPWNCYMSLSFKSYSHFLGQLFKFYFFFFLATLKQKPYQNSTRWCWELRHPRLYFMRCCFKMSCFTGFLYKIDILKTWTYVKNSEN